MIADTHLDLEENVLGAMLVTERAVDAVLTSGLRAEHLTRPRSRLIYKAIAKLSDAGEPIDTLTVPEFSSLTPSTPTDAGQPQGENHAD